MVGVFSCEGLAIEVGQRLKAEHVVEVLIATIPNMSAPQAINIMMEAHQYGMALVITCNQEHAEHYSEVLKSHGLTSTIEPAD